MHIESPTMMTSLKMIVITDAQEWIDLGENRLYWFRYMVWNEWTQKVQRLRIVLRRIYFDVTLRFILLYDLTEINLSLYTLYILQVEYVSNRLKCWVSEKMFESLRSLCNEFIKSLNLSV